VLDKESMKEMVKDYIPFLWHQEEPVEMYLIDNKLCKFFDSGVVHQGNPTVSFNTLQELFLSNDRLKEAVPKDLHVFFTRISPYPIIDSMYQHFVGINDPHYVTRYLDLETRLDTTKNLVTFKDIFFRDKSIDISFDLTIDDAFLLLSNTCLATRGPRLISNIRSYGLYSLKEFIKEKNMEDWFVWKRNMLEKKYQKHISISPSYKVFKQQLIGSNTHEMYYTETIDRFLIAYIKYIISQLEKKTITFSKLFKLNGIRLLLLFLPHYPFAHDFIQDLFSKILTSQNLHFEQQIRYIAPLEILKFEIQYYYNDSQISTLITNFYQENATLISKLSSRLREFRSSIKYKSD